MIKFIKLLCLCLIFSQLSCEKENIEIDKNIPSKFIIKKIYKSEINSVKGLNNKLQQAIQTNNNLQGRIVNDSLYNFSINTDLATYIDNGEYQTYTFEVYRNNGNGKLENLILKSDNSGGFYSILVKYDFTKEIFNQDNFNPNNFSLPLYTYIDFDYNQVLNSKCVNNEGALVCSESWSYKCNGTIDQGDNNGNTDFTEQCGWVMSVGFCTYVYGEGCGGASENFGGLDTSPTGDNHGGYSAGGYNMTQINNAIALLPYSQQQWLNQLINEETKTQTAIYIIENNSSQEAVGFATQLINLAISNDASFQFDDTIDSSNTLVFNTIQDFENHLETNLATLEETDFEIDAQNQRIATAKLSYGTFGITIKVKQNMLPTYEVVNVSSVKTGLSILLSYEQTDYNVDIVGSYVNVDIYGLATTGIKITVPFEANITFEDEVHFRIVIDKNTGHLITAYEIND